MTFNKLLFVTALSFSMMGVTAKANDVVLQVPVDTTFAADDMRWTNGKIGYSYRIKLVAHNGRLAVCGMGHFGDAEIRPAVENMLRGSKITADGKVALENFRFFNRVNRRSELDKATANCADAGPMPRDPNSIQFEFGNSSYRN